MEEQIIGYLSFQGCFLCPMCNALTSSNKGNTPIYALEIKPHSQDCAMCKRVVYKGEIQTILYDNKMAYTNYLRGEKHD
jgi:hypothetical protein